MTSKLSEGSMYRIGPSSEEDVCWAAELASRVYHGFDALPAAVMLGWYRSNPTGFSTLFRDGQRVGNVDVLPLKPLYMRRFIEGQILEIDLPPESLFTPAQRDEIRDLYWESIVIDPELSLARRHVLKAILQGYEATLGRICPLHQINHTYAIAASKEGSALASALGMVPVGDPSTRRDAHQLFQGTLASFAAAVAPLRRSRTVVAKD